MRILFAAAAILLTICTDALGQAYRWVDQDGRVHYTQAPPPPVAAKNFPVTLYTLADCGSHEGLLNALLDSAGYPSYAPPGADRNAAKDESRGSSAAPAGRGCQCRAGARCRRQMTGGAVSFRAARQFAEITA